MCAMIAKMSRSQPVNQQVEAYIRSLIMSKEWLPGARVPSNQALAETTGTSVFTVQAALARLSKEGLIERKRKVGTFVKGGNIELSCVGIYIGSQLWNYSDSTFYQVLHGVLQTKLESLGLKTKVWFDDRPRKNHGKIFQPLKKAVHDRDIQAVIAPQTDPDEVQWLSKLPIAATYLTMALGMNNGVSSDDYYMICTALKELHAKGCKKVGMISSLRTEAKIIGQGGIPINYHQCFIDEAKKLGMKADHSWILPHSLDNEPKHKPTFGYAQFQTLWDQPEHPDGLFVFPDNVVTGVITAILARRVDVPKELKLVLHANDQIPYLCPMPASFLVTKVGEVADALFETLKAQSLGNPCQHITYKSVLRRSQGGFPTGLTTYKD